MRILIVEDESSSRVLLKRFLEPYGEIDIAQDGVEAVAKFKQALHGHTLYDLVCLDIKMPTMDGISALKVIRQLEQDRGIKQFEGTKVIMTTQVEEPSDVLGAFKFGCEAYVVKPVNRANLLGEIQKLGLLTSEIIE